MRWICVLASLMVAVACGGGGNASSAGGGLRAVPQRALVAVTMAEDSAEDVGGVYVTFSKVSLVPKDGSDPVVLFESTDGQEVNFSALDNEDLLFSVSDSVPTGTYTKLLVQVESIRVVGGPCEDLDTSVPDDEIELVPEEEIDIEAGDKIVIALAMNSDQSVQIKVDGENEQCIFQPVVKVTVGFMTPPEAQECPTSARGEVTEILLNIHNEVLGFVLDLGDTSDPQTVLIFENTGMFGTDGTPTSPDTIRLGDDLLAKGRLNEDGEMLADVIVAGDVITFHGTVLSVPERGIVRVMPDEGESVVGETSVRLFDATLILFDCQDATAASLTRGAKVTITGKVAPDRETFLAADVEVDPVVIVGSLTGCTEVDDGFEITVLPVGVAIEVTIFVPDEVGIQLQGDGDIPKALLEELLACEPLPVRVSIAMDEGDGTGDAAERALQLLLTDDEPRTASEVRVGAETRKGRVARIDAASGLLLLDETLVQVLRTATIVDLRDGETLGSLGDIEPGDCVRVFGLRACEGDTDRDFYAFVLVVLGDEPDRPVPDRFEGCGHGYWKNHLDAWPAGYSPDDLFDDIFEETFRGKTLLYVLKRGGGGIHALGRETVAALLNAAADDIAYRYTEREVIRLFNEAAPHGAIESLKNRFEYNNNLGCARDDDDRHDDEDEWEHKDRRDDGDDGHGESHMR